MLSLDSWSWLKGEISSSFHRLYKEVNFIRRQEDYRESSKVTSKGIKTYRSQNFEVNVIIHSILRKQDQYWIFDAHNFAGYLSCGRSQIWILLPIGRSGALSLDFRLRTLLVTKRSPSWIQFPRDIRIYSLFWINHPSISRLLHSGRGTLFVSLVFCICIQLFL